VLDASFTMILMYNGDKINFIRKLDKKSNGRDPREGLTGSHRFNFQIRQNIFPSGLRGPGKLFSLNIPFREPAKCSIL